MSFPEQAYILIMVAGVKDSLAHNYNHACIDWLKLVDGRVLLFDYLITFPEYSLTTHYAR